MEAKELRIGNLVILKRPFYTYEKGDIFTLSNVGVDYLDSWQQMGASDELKIRDVEPIPLTEEWLVKFGFDISEDKNSHNLKKAVVDGFRVNTYFDEEVGYWWLGYYHNKKQPKLKYVHQLQNLYFALTGEELECKI